VALCRAWDATGTTPEAISGRIPDVPTIVLTGELDPATPPAGIDDMLAALSRSRHVIVPGLGHSPAWTSCLSSVTASFIDAADPATLDVSCSSTPFAAAWVTSTGIRGRVLLGAIVALAVVSVVVAISALVRRRRR